MSVMINGAEFPDIDFTDVEVLEHYQHGLNEFQSASKRLSGCTQLSDMIEAIREICDIVADWMDDLFGDGAGDMALGGKASLKIASTVSSDIISAYHNDFVECRKITERKAEEINSMAGNRQQRRSAERDRQRKKKKAKVRYFPSDPSNADRYDPGRVQR